MADYIAQPDSSVDPDAPVTSDLMYALRDNPIAIAEGSAGAPRIADAALSTTVTAAGRDWVGRRYASSSWNSVGATVMGVVDAISTTGTTPVNSGQSVAGSLIRPTNAAGAVSAGYLTGNWECMGYIPNRNQTTDVARTTLWRRVS